jgi:DNA-binding NarL/FixJ family response regulator
MENSALATTFHGHQLRVIGKSPGLLEGLDRLESEGVQLVVLGSGFSEEELALFVLDARRRGFRGTALRVLGQVSQSYRFDPVYDSQAEEKQAAADQSTITNPPSDGSPEPSRSISFTDKERAVLARVSSGWTNMQIARDLNCSEGSVKAIIQQLFGKLGVRKRAQVVRMAFESGFRSPL